MASSNSDRLSLDRMTARILEIANEAIANGSPAPELDSPVMETIAMAQIIQIRLHPEKYGIKPEEIKNGGSPELG